uniref:tRNA N(3)-methylcytidine methyltransferase n=1 Tax=Kwoniella dejecticola CBS 10117 TaxID=1296121 RepID=A0A1A6ABK2_9TREE|nr:S-adenosylmethionine-dependent methyltransferase [Kwoniella dejecticola CBS 10117]OBR87428.1 S-adenosylmethionine-dependent methyltransferase [Kwoniella dejecticola CBS 10117]
MAELPPQAEASSSTTASTASCPAPLVAPEPVLAGKMRVADKWVKPNGPPVGSTFGARLLNSEKDVFEHNAWDHVTLPEDFKMKAQEIMELHRSSPVAEGLRDGYNSKPAHYWDKFYALHEEGFFKDRQWLRLEFPELVACSEADAGPKIVLEVGCGAGNTVFPLLMRNENPDLHIYATDYSARAVEVVKANKMYPRAEHGLGELHASVWDITSKPSSSSSSSSSSRTTTSSVTTLSLDREADEGYSLPEGIQPGTVDVISVIFVLSALHPKEWDQAIRNLYTALKPGGLLLIRDYGRHDLAQLRIKKDRLLDPEIPNLYIRGDGTRVYFFEKEELERMLVAPPSHSSTKDQQMKQEVQSQEGPKEGEEERGVEKKMFEVLQLGEDRRLLVNRKEKKQMYRIWLQVKAKKL